MMSVKQGIGLQGTRDSIFSEFLVDNEAFFVSTSVMQKIRKGPV
jgi:hypothetical protein